jgi:hypothetical protein
MENNKKYLIIPLEEISKVDFSLVCETSINTLRKSIDESKTFVKWIDDESTDVSSLLSIPNCEGPYSHGEILKILSTSEWIKDNI